MIEIVKQIWRDKGLRGFWAGARLRVAYYSPYQTVWYVLFQALVTIF